MDIAVPEKDDLLHDARLMRVIFRLGIPATLGLSASAVNQFIDAFWITRLSPVSMAAIGLTFPLFLVAASTTVGLGVATSTEIGRRLGRKDRQGADDMALTGLVTAMGIGAVVALLIGVFAEPALRVTGASDATLSQAKTYLIILLCAAPLGAFQIISDFVALGSGNPKHSMKALFAAFGTNMVLDPIFIFVLDLGVLGAALATICGQIVAFVVFLRWYRRGDLGIKPGRGRYRRADLRVFAKYAPPVSGVGLLTALSFLILINQASALGGDTLTAALSFDLRLVSLVLIPIQGISLGAQSAVSRAYGAGHHARARALSNRLLVVSLIFGLISLVILGTGSGPIINALVPDAAMAADAKMVLNVLAVYVLASCLYIPPLSSFQATERPIAAAVVGLAPSGYLMIPLTLILAAQWGIDGLMAAPVISSIAAALMALALHFYGKTPDTVTATPSQTL